ncbi:MAG: TetR family transcriptional regulator [Gammaproteobacteria bacterium]|nr:TetR family transcriptional regulator [Gammaproteobacteria bacterium]
MRQAVNKAKRTDTTRTLIISTAETLFAEHGVSGVTINSINQAAGQKNSNAVRYHFGDKTGLLLAIIDKHLEQIAERRKIMLKNLARRGDHSLRDLVETLVHPIARQMNEPCGGEAFIHINAEFITVKAFSFYKEIDNPIRIHFEDQLILLFQAHMSHLPKILAMKRMILVSGMIYNGLSNHARIRHQLPAGHPLIDFDLAVCNLVDAIVAILSSPVSDEAAKLIARKPVSKS